MSFFKKILGIEESEENKEIKSEYDHTLEESMILNMAKIKQKIVAIKIYYPEKAEEIEKGIDGLKKHIEEQMDFNPETQTYIDETYQKIKEDFESFRK